ncbi:acetyl-CoA carboxylase biotin carboxyl carrier protein [Vibrio viridaestus]|nr:biotin/lipoyl-containing protein [Vibrio viridaestus]
MPEEKLRVPEIRTLTDLMNQTRIQELDIQSKDWSLKLRKQIPQSEISHGDFYETTDEVNQSKGEQQISLILSPSIGIFLPCHPSDKENIVKVGEIVSVNQVIGFLKVGPIFLPVTSPFNGQVKEIYVGYGDLVGFEDKLVAINQ